MFFDLDKPIKVTGFGRIGQKGGFWHTDWSQKNFLLFYLSEGDLVMSVGDREVAIHGGDVLIIPPHTPYRPLQSGGCTYYHFYFFASVCEEAESKFSIRHSHCKNLPNFSFSYNYTEHTVIELQELTHSTEQSRLNKIINRCAELDLWHHPEEKMLLDNYLREILIQLSFLREKSSEKEQSFMRMVLFIQSNYMKSITLKEVSEAAHLSPSYAAKLFRKNSGMRCCDYINNVRLSAACELLVNTPTTISKIAEMVGYNSQYYFARCFKNTYGINAMQYRKKGNE